MSGQKLMIVIPGMDTGGAEMQLTQKLNLFPEFDMTLVILSDRNSLLHHIRLPNHKIKVYNQPTLRYLNVRGVFRAIPISWQMMKQGRAEKIRHVIAHLPMAHWTSRWMILFSYVCFYPMRLIVYHHSEQYKANPVKGFFHKVFTHFQSLLAYATDAGNLFVSEAVKKDISRLQYVRNGSVIKNLVAEKDSNPRLAQNMLAAQKKIFEKYIVIPGRVERVKGQLFFARVLTPELIKEIQRTNTLIVFAGGGSDEKDLVDALPGNVRENVFITGVLEHPVLLSFLSLSDLVVIPSLSEGSGNTLIESMMLKRNVISSNAGGLKETIHDSNAVEWFGAGDAAHMQQKIAAWFGGELFFQSEKAYAYYRAKFSPEVHREELLRYLNLTFSFNE